MTSPTTDRRLGPRTVALATSLLVAALAIVPALVMWARRDEFPARVATHWGASGQPDDWTSLGAALVTAGVLTLVMPLVLLALGAAMRAIRELAALALGMAVFLAGVSQGATWAQRGTDGSGQISIARVLGGALVAALLVGIAAWLVLAGVAAPEPRLPGGRTPTAAPLDLPDGARVAWFGGVRVARGPLVFAGTVLVVALALDAWLWLRVDRGIAAVVLLVTLVAALGLAMFASRVTIDQRGVRLSALGVPFVRIPLAAITGASVDPHVEPLGNYGGWGWRLGHDGRSSGLVTSAGEGLVVQRGDQRDLVVTIDRADEAAAVLATLLDARG